MAPAAAVRLLTAAVFASSLALSGAEASSCKGGAEASCECLLGCPVFGSQPDKCTGDKEHEKVDQNMVVGNVVQNVLAEDSGAACDGIKCIVKCAQFLGCLDQRVMGKCMNVRDSQKVCDVDCNSAYRAAGAAPFLALLLAAVAAAAGLCPLALW
mmetsp:Transcript_18934/g.42932  ORF Transcript_18934/g.42932 Transcript_18934/m.42932 type:complete len:155 (-) Transcript_18934:114-578(-)|eukprot:CAMPEP_0197888296 /NCGR_PEP_ID=MMETSP1439-20131203/21915_1 /TAXON_ID=66791 /ORGANISM="Gonyaulax spinifera, Strain CCMP409" /LENGTH=154 /DNA_ID=CAMNT_0043508201 /DNA_START=70 /DNA_END=534 /DNA_ORIENTATION=+